MQIPLQIGFRGCKPSAAVEADVREKAARLEKFCERITSVRVVIAMPHQRHHKGKLFRVRVDVRVPGNELIVGRDPAARHEHEDVFVAVRDAFDAARRQLEDYVRERRAPAKAHTAPPEGRVSRLFADRGYGFITTADGREVYFHRNALVDDAFERLHVGDEVRFDEEMGEQGPQASTVHLAS